MSALSSRLVRRCRRCRRRRLCPLAGFTLIELLVSLAIGMVLSLAIYGILAAAEGRKRTTTTTNDANQAGAYALYMMDKVLRSAGSGFSQSHEDAFGCKLNAFKAGTRILPLPAPGALPAPFGGLGGVAGEFRLAPVLIAAGGTTPGISGRASDALIVMAGASGLGEYPTRFAASAAGSQLRLTSAFDFNANDIVLVADKPTALDIPDCLLGQVAPGPVAVDGSVDLAGAYAAPDTGSGPLAGYSTNAVALNLGNVVRDNAPSFLVLGVGANNTLFSYDLLQTSSQPLRVVADKVFELHALYHVDTDSDGRAETWVSPASNDYRLAELSAGTKDAANRLARIKALRVGLILRSNPEEKTPVTPGPLFLFSDLNGLKYRRDLVGGETHYRYRTIETTIPLRNAQLLD